MVLPSLRCRVQRGADGCQHVALPEVQCDTHRYLHVALFESSLVQAVRGRSSVSEPSHMAAFVEPPRFTSRYQPQVSAIRQATSGASGGQ